jgi:hypothetical protein
MLHPQNPQRVGSGGSSLLRVRGAAGGGLFFLRAKGAKGAEGKNNRAPEHPAITELNQKWVELLRAGVASVVSLLTLSPRKEVAVGGLLTESLDSKLCLDADFCPALMSNI